MITKRRRRAANALALFLIFTVAQVYIQVNLAGPNVKVKDATPLPAQGGGQLTGKLTTTGGKPILVNGASLGSGGTLLTGAVIDVPDGVGATIDLGPLGQLDLAPNTTVELVFSDGEVKVKIRKGCAILRTKKGTNGEVSTDQGVAATNDKNKNGVADVCFPLGGGSPIVNAGAAANAGAGAGAGAAGGGGGLFGLGPWGTLGVISGGIAAGIGIYKGVHRGRNPSPGTPRGPV
ncbi:MAG TPA: hypothetical protein VF544_22315 [Pyrinomonadaceae bacterium]|jgi:hypothetical protein